MKDKKQHIDNEFLSEETLLQYRQGKLSNAEMRQVEGLLEKYPLYAEALEGLELLAESKSQESIVFLKGFADKQMLSSQTSKTISLRQANLMRVAAAIALLFVCSLGIYFLNINSEMMSQGESTSAVPPPPSDEQKLMEESPDLGQASEQAEASNQQELVADNQPSNKDGIVSKLKQEALNDKQTNQSSKPIQINDSLLTLARKNKDSRGSETVITDTDAVLAEKKAEEEKPKSTTVLAPPAPIQSTPVTPADDKGKDMALGGEVVKSDAKELKSNNSTTDDDLVEKDTKKAKKKVVRERNQRNEISSEKQSSSIHGGITSDGLDPDLKATLKKQIMDLAKAQNETPKGKFSAKITFAKGEKLPQVTIQTMPCQACKTDSLIKTIENHQFTDKTERLIEIEF